MLVDALNSSNYLSFNITAAHNIGLENAVYCSELLSIYNKAKKKGRLDGEYFMVDRKYIESRTTLDCERQMACDAFLKKIGVLDVDDVQPNLIKFDSVAFAKVITSDDKSFLKSIAKEANPSKSAKNAKIAKMKSIASALKKSISVDDDGLRKSLERWVDVMVDTNKMTKESVVQFQFSLSKYAKNDVALSKKIVDVAIAQKYSNCIWAIESYERERKMSNSVRRTNINVATDSNLSDKVY